MEDRSALYAAAGPADGRPVVLVHGWALGQRSFRPAMQRLAALGHRVFAPSLPGFGGTPGLARRSFSLDGYAAWLVGFLDAMDLTGPVVVVGHSFGGAVSIRLASDAADRVRSLVLVNAVGGAAWRTRGKHERTLADRPLWDWGLSFPTELLPLRAVPRVVPTVISDAVPNLVRNPWGAWRVAELTRGIDLGPELRALRASGLPVTVVWGRSDRIVPRASFEAMCEALGTEGIEVDGTHAWLIAEPDAFATVVAEVIDRQVGGGDRPSAGLPAGG